MPPEIEIATVHPTAAREAALGESIEATGKHTERFDDEQASQMRVSAEDRDDQIHEDTVERNSMEDSHSFNSDAVDINNVSAASASEGHPASISETLALPVVLRPL